MRDVLRQRVEASREAKALAEQLRAKPKKRLRDEVDARDQLRLAKLLFDARKCTKAEFFFQSVFQVERVHEGRWLDGAYDAELSPISQNMSKVEREHGLSENESFFRDSAPDEWLEFNSQYEDLMNVKFGETLLEFGLTEWFALWRDKRDEYDRLRETGRVAFLEHSNVEKVLGDLISTYEQNAQRAASAGAHVAATVMVGFAAEARLRLHCALRPDAARFAAERLSGKLKPRSADPRRWNFVQLVSVAHAGGWLHNLPHEELLVEVAEWLDNAHEAQAEMPKGRSPSLVGEDEFERAREAYRAMKTSLDLALQSRDQVATLQ